MQMLNMEVTGDNIPTTTNDAASGRYKKLGDRWSTVFAQHGEVWGDKASPSGILLIKQVEAMRDRLISAGTQRPYIRIFEAGYGYGRDMKALLDIKKANIHVNGIENSDVGRVMADRTLRSAGKSNDEVYLGGGDFVKNKNIPVPSDSYDFFLSHRMMHLLGTNGKLKLFMENAHSILKPGGTAIVSARDERDFKEDSMVRRPDGTVSYKDRPDHIFSLWRTRDLVKVFERNGFDVQEAIQEEEVESTLHPDEMSRFTIIRAVKKFDFNPS